MTTMQALEKARKSGDAWDNRGGPRGAGNTAEGLTHSSDSSREGLLVKSTRVCSVDDCGNPVHCRGWCNGHYRRWKSSGDVQADLPLTKRVGSYAGAACYVGGCDKPARKRGWCRMHYARWEKDGDPGCADLRHYLDDPTGARRLADFSRYDVGCIRWTGAHTRTGYGRMTIDGGHVAPHRLSYELSVGPIPEGLVIDHLCRVRDCIDPSHLEPVTVQENILRTSLNYRRAVGAWPKP